MKKILFLQLLSTVITLNSQIIEKPLYQHEKLFWDQTLSEIRTVLAGKHLKETKLDNNPFMKNQDQFVLYTYIDSIGNETYGVGLQFRKSDSCLSSVIVTYLGIDSETKNQYEDFELRRDKLLTVLTGHYRAEYEDRSIPFMGSIRVWSAKESKIQAQINSSSLVIMMRKR